MSGRTMSPVMRYSLYVLVAIAFAVACVFLSQWQFDRNDARSAQLELVERNYDAAPIELSDAVSGIDAFDASLEWHPVTVRGRYLADEAVVVRNRPYGGTSAFEVLVPLETEDGRILIVDRGWVPPAETGDGPDAVPSPPEGEVTVVVRLRPSEPLPTSGRSAPEGQVPTIHLPLIAQAAGSQTITAAYGVLDSEDPAAETPFALPSPSDDPGPHLSYAIQWILFAIMGFVFIGYIIRTERRHRREDVEETADAADERYLQSLAADRQPKRSRRRPDRDAAAEDALLDHADS